MPLTPGTTLGPYTVTAQIGAGGMGEVYRARDTKLDRDVALKVLPDAFTSDPDRLARFEREAKVLASLNHPNIGHIYGLEEAEGTKALVLELVEGPTLADRIAEGPIPTDEALPIAKQIAEALEAAHEQGIIHRDLKPANVKVKVDGTVKVLDFGLAKAFQPDASGASASESPTISLTAAATQMGMVIGTAAYMSPEQAKGKPVDKRADVWGFGCVLFEMVTGRKPFIADDVSDTLALVLKFEPDWDALPPDTPARLRQLVQTCLQKDPKQRVHDVADVRLAMEGAFETTGSAPSESVLAPMLRIWQRPVGFAVGVLVALAVGGVATWSLSRPAPPPPGLVTRFAIPLGTGESSVFRGLPIVAISPDGTHVVYAADGSLWLRPVDQLQAVHVPGTEGGGGPLFSADGQSIGFWADGQLKKVAVNGGAPLTIADGLAPLDGASWGADDLILYGERDGIMQVPGAGGTPELLIPADAGEHLHGPQMLPDGEWVLFMVLAAGQTSWDEAQIVAQSVATGERRVLIEGGRDGRYQPTGHLVYVLNNVLLAVPFDVDLLEVTGGPVPLVEGIRVARGDGASAFFGVSANGSLVYVPGSAGGGETLLTWVGRDGDEENLPAPPRTYGRPRVSPDGGRVAVDITEGNSRDIWIWDLEQETLTQLTFDEADDNYPLWTRDSARVLFTSTREGGGLFWKAADGTGQVERLKPGLARPYAWAVDGRLLFEEGRDVGVLTMEGERRVEMLLDDAGFNEGEPALSPDGRWLAYYRTHEVGPPTIDVVPFPNIHDGRWSISQGAGAVVQPVWSPNGSELFYRSDTDLMVAQIETEPTFSNRTPEPLFSLSDYEMAGGPDDARTWDLAPDGARFLVRAAATKANDDEAFNSLIFISNWFEELKARVPVN